MNIKNNILDKELEVIGKTNLKLQIMINKKGKTSEHLQILTETLEFTRRIQQKLLDERDNTQEATSTN